MCNFSKESRKSSVCVFPQKKVEINFLYATHILLGQGVFCFLLFFFNQQNGVICNAFFRRFSCSYESF